MREGLWLALNFCGELVYGESIPMADLTSLGSDSMRVGTSNCVHTFLIRIREFFLELQDYMN